MTVICPAILQDTPEKYKADLDKVTGFAKRIQIDIADGIFTPNNTINLIQVYWPADVQADLHLMLKEPLKELETVISLNPSLVIIHAEADGDLVSFFMHINQVGIRTGLAFLPQTTVASQKSLIEQVDHVLIFGGTLGSYGGKLDRSCLVKAKEAKAIKPDLELGWDGGINEQNAIDVSNAGFDVLNTGGYLQKADDPQVAYAKLEAVVKG